MAGKTSVFCICYFGYFLIQQEPVYLSDLLWPSFLFAITPVTASAAKLSSITTPHSAGSPASPVCGVLLPAEGCCEDALCPRSGRGLSEASGFCPLPLSELPELLGQHRTIPALRLKHRSGGCGTAPALPKCSIIHKVLSALLA